MNITLINYDNGSRWPVLPQNLYHLKKCAEDAGHRVRIIDFNLTKRPYEDLLKLTSEDVIGLGFISGYWPHQEALKIAEVIRRHPTRKSFLFVIGGHGPSADPIYYRKKLASDAVFVGPADISFINWLKGPTPGIFTSEGYDLNKPQVITNSEEMEVYKRVRFPNTKEDEFAIQILSGRGCPYNCAFCFRMGSQYQAYEVDSIMLDIEKYYRIYGIKHFQFSDELLMVSEKKCNSFVDHLVDLQTRLGVNLAFDCNGRLNVAAASKDLLRRMKEAGFRYINYGVEALDDRVLKNINKHQTVKEIKKGIRNTVHAGLTPGINIMFGNPGDNEETLKKAVDFLLDNDTCHELRTIRPVTPFPGTNLFKMLNITVDEFYEKHLNSDLFSFHFMEGISNMEADKMLLDANNILYDNYVKVNTHSIKNKSYEFYNHLSNPGDFRGWRTV